MSLDVHLHTVEGGEVYWANITHNLAEMADEAGLYGPVWRPEQDGIAFASQLIEPLAKGITLMESDPERFKAFDSPNGWGKYEHFLPWLAKYLAACREYPDAAVSVSR